MEKYLRIACNFVELEYSITSVSDDTYKNQCARCGNTSDFEQSEGLLTCENCGSETDTVSAQSSFKDIDRINIHQKFKYEKKSHFREGVTQYQGKQNTTINKAVYEGFDIWLKKHGLLNENGTTKKERYTNVQKDHIRLYLSESPEDDMNKHYDNVNLIYSNVTGIPCPDISHLEDKLYRDFDILVDAFMLLKGDEVERKNFLNTQFVLRKLLLMNGHKIDPTDFPGLKTLSRVVEHEDIFAKLCQSTGLNNPE